MRPAKILGSFLSPSESTWRLTRTEIVPRGGSGSGLASTIAELKWRIEFPSGGGPEECVEQLQEVISAGARLVLLNPVFDMMEQMEILAQEIVPRLSGR